MSLTNHYPFATIPLNYNLTSFEDFLDFQTLSIHYNQIYKEFVDDLNFILSTEISLQKLTLDEILFNEKILSPFRKNDIIKYAGEYITIRLFLDLLHQTLLFQYALN
ncbi:MAG: hypothetical protein V8Q77_03940 [Bacilli bacterium]